jgi:DNA modification methylase
MFLYIRKSDSRLVVEGKPDWIQCDPVLPSERTHTAEKPIPLLLDLLSRVSLPGQVMVDPFIGSGSAIEAGLRSQLICSGCDIALESYVTASSRIAKFLEKEEA